MSNVPDERHVKFADDLERMGYEVVEYHGRYGYAGPAVKVQSHEFQDVLRATAVRVVWDDLGKGMVIYPDCARRIEEQKDLLRFDDALKDIGVVWNRGQGQEKKT